MTSANPSRSRFQVVSRSSGITRVSATVVMKLVSPTQRGMRVHVQVAGHARARGLAQIQPEVEAVGMVDPFRARSVSLGQVDQFVRGFEGSLASRSRCA